MKKWLVGSVVGAILLFVWQFISWALADLHNKEFKYVPGQEQLLSSLSSNIKEDGQYRLPQAPPGSSQEEKQKVMEQSSGKPYALVIYKTSLKTDMVVPIIRSLAVDFILVLLMIFIIGRMVNLNLGNVWMCSLAIGFVAWLWYPYTQNIWFQTPIEIVTGALMDWFVGYSLLGLWLGFWLPRSTATRAK
jgi:hypothetical protein